MTIKTIQVQGLPFAVVAPRKASGSIPDASPPHQPPAITTTATSQNWAIAGEAGLGLWSGGAVTSNSGTITVADNDFTDGSYLVLGDNTLWPYRDYTPGANAGATATAIAAAINRLPNYTATANLTVVSVGYDPSGDVVEFRSIRLGTVTNFTLSPTTGSLTLGNPHIEAIELA